MPDNLDVLKTTFDMINADDQLLWASDYPHWDMDVPSVIYDLPFLDERQKHKMLGGNAIDLFNLDVSPRFPDYKPV
jgi:predicted TIM-barrel fold metal-dependent hydrolase